MNDLIILPIEQEKCMNMYHEQAHSVMVFPNKTWEYFHPSQIKERLEHWKSIVGGSNFRVPTETIEDQDKLSVILPKLPNGYFPFSDISSFPSDTHSRGKLILSLLNAISHLHQHQFHLGFLFPELVYFHPKTLEVLLDVQPFSSGFPFVNNTLSDYPYIYFSRFARRYQMPRTSDFYAVGLFIYWVFAEGLPTDPIGKEERKEVPEFIQELSRKLMHEPEKFLFLEEIAHVFFMNGFDPSQVIQEEVRSHANFLHPGEPPICTEDKESLFKVLHGKENQWLGIWGEDESARHDMYYQCVPETIEHNFFVRVICKNMPFHTLRELVRNSIELTEAFFPDSIPKVRSYSRKFEQFLKDHYDGDDILHLLADWFYHFYTDIIKVISCQNICCKFENSHDFDEDSQRVLLSFWKQYQHALPGFHAIFSGLKSPSLFTDDLIYSIKLEGTNPDILRNLLTSKLVKAEPSLIEELVHWFSEEQIEYHQSHTILEELIETKQIFLSNQGWVKSSPSLWMEIPEVILRKRILGLRSEELEFLSTLSFLPIPNKCRAMFQASGYSLDSLYHILSHLSRSGLLNVYYDNSVCVPTLVKKLLLNSLSAEQKKHCSHQALQLYYQYQPNNVPPLLELAKQAGQIKLEYYLLVQYYRQVRSLLTFNQQKDILEKIKQLHLLLARRPLYSWDRILCRVYQLLNQFDHAEEIASSLFAKSRAEVDRLELVLIRMLKDQLDLPQAKKELLQYLDQEENTLEMKALAATILCRSIFVIPLERAEALKLHQFYLNRIYPNRNQVTTRGFSNLTLNYTVVLLEYLPEHEEWAMELLAKLSSILELTHHYDLKLRMYDTYTFQSNSRGAFENIQRGIEGSRRSGFTQKEQIGHLNAMEISLYLGNLASYRYHKERVLLVDEIRRPDLEEEYLCHQLLYASEWEDWDLFEKLQHKLSKRKMSESKSVQMDAFQSYAVYRNGLPLLKQKNKKDQNYFTLFVNGLHAIKAGDIHQAYDFFKKSIHENGYRLCAGWAYREMLTLLLKDDLKQMDHWLKKFEEYLNKYSYTMFWPDYFRLLAESLVHKGEINQALLYLRRALNGYQLIGKPKCQSHVMRRINQIIQPSFFPILKEAYHEPFVQQLMQEREKFIHESNDLRMIIQLSEQITQNIELIGTMNRLIQALFDYFPVVRLSVSYQLRHRKEKNFYSASGLIEQDELLFYQWHDKPSQSHEFCLYKHGDQHVSIEAFIQNGDKTKLEHMEHFLSVMKPHIANAILYHQMMIDDLTGFYQRRYFLQKLKEEFEISKRYSLDLSLIMVDVDNFRKVNELGHTEGDKVLQELSDIIRSVFRKQDILGRFGGEELLLILPKTDGHTALKLARKLQRQVEEEFSHGRPYRVTVSVGVSSLELCRTLNMDELIHDADNAEITAKMSGKNKVIAAWNNPTRVE